MLFRLAAYLGKTVSELDITWDEFVYWQAYMNLRPPEEPANRRTAAVMAQIANMSGRSLRGDKTLTAEDFLGEHKGQTAEEQIAFMRSVGGEE